jgi:hypothetical protein
MGSGSSAKWFLRRATADSLIDIFLKSAADLKRQLTGHFALDAVGLRFFVTSRSNRDGAPRLPI